MSNVARVVLFLFFLFVNTVAVSQEPLSPEVSSFVQLLVKMNQPTLYEYAKFSGECGGESELTFVLKECQSRKWVVNSKSCIKFSQERCRRASRQPSLALNWLRERFFTVGKTYRLISVRSLSGNFSLVNIEIGNNKFSLFHDASSLPIGGLVVGVSSVNGKKIKEYLDK